MFVFVVNMKISQVDIQQKFFSYLFNVFGKERVFNEIKEILHLQRGAIYKRINGDTALTSEELFKISRHFKVSLDTTLDNNPFFSFTHPFIDLKESVQFLDVFKFYLKPMIYQESNELIYLANELPVFYYLAYPEIFNFQTGIWDYKMGSKLKIPHKHKISSELSDLNSAVQAYYNSNPVTEIWNSTMLSNLYQQVLFCIGVRAFENQNQLEILVNDIHKMLSDLKKTVEDGDSGNHKIYLNDFGTYLNLVLYNRKDLKASFIGMDIPQFMVSHDETYFDFAMDWVNKIKEQSVLISSGGYQNKELFFVKLDKDFLRFKDNTQKLISLYY